MSNMSWMCSGKLPGMPAGVSTAGFGVSLNRSASLDPPLDFADAGQVFVELLMVAPPSCSLEAAGVVEHEIEDRSLLLARGVPGSCGARPAHRRRRAARRRAADSARERPAAVGPLHDRLN